MTYPEEQKAQKIWKPRSYLGVSPHWDSAQYLCKETLKTAVGSIQEFYSLSHLWVKWLETSLPRTNTAQVSFRPIAWYSISYGSGWAREVKLLWSWEPQPSWMTVTLRNGCFSIDALWAFTPKKLIMPQLILLSLVFFLPIFSACHVVTFCLRLCCPCVSPLFRSLKHDHESLRNGSALPQRMAMKAEDNLSQFRALATTSQVKSSFCSVTLYHIKYFSFLYNIKHKSFLGIKIWRGLRLWRNKKQTSCYSWQMKVQA